MNGLRRSRDITSSVLHTRLRYCESNVPAFERAPLRVNQFLRRRWLKTYAADKV